MIETVLELAIVVVAFGLSALWAARVIYARGRLAGINEAMREMAGGVAVAYQRPGTPAPERVKHAADVVRRNLRLSATASEIAGALRDLGREMGATARLQGLKEGETPRNEEIRIDLLLKELLTIRWLAHAGFKLMMRNRTGGKFSFCDEVDAQESNFALDRLERRLAEAHKDPTMPYQLALSRQQTIWERWPHTKEAQASLQNAA